MSVRHRKNRSERSALESIHHKYLVQMTCIHIWNSDFVTPRTSQITRLPCAYGNQTAFVVVPWIGITFTTDHVPSYLHQSLHLQRATKTILQRFPTRREYAFDDIVTILRRYKSRQCTYKTFAGEIIIFRKNTITFIDTNRSVILLIGCPLNLLSASLFISGVLALIV